MNLNFDNKLFHNYLNGDNEAIKDIFMNYFSSLVLIAYKYTNSESDAQDIVSEIFCKLCEINQNERKQKFSRFDGKFIALLKAMVRNKAIDFYRAPKNKKRDNAADLEEYNNKIQLNDIYLFSETIEDLITVLTDKEKIIFSLYIEGFPPKEIGEKLNLSIKTIQNSISLIKNKLRKQWEKSFV